MPMILKVSSRLSSAFPVMLIRGGWNLAKFPMAAGVWAFLLQLADSSLDFVVHMAVQRASRFGVGVRYPVTP